MTPGHSRSTSFSLLLPVPKTLCLKVILPFLSQFCDAQGERFGKDCLSSQGGPDLFFLLSQFMMDASNPTQLSASCVQLLGLLSAEQLAEASVLILFNKMDLPCYMTIEEMQSLIRLPDIIACAKQNITTAEISALRGTGLSEVLRWLQDTHRTHS
uniref:ARF like GTPase 16 n=1 Tax=Equus asinus TaxID=9793 RepID=A0A9L0IHK0_EQUAS